MPAGPFDEPYQKLGGYLALEAKQLTTRISQALLMHAAAGRVRQYIYVLLAELAKGTEAGTSQAAKHVLSIGSMSGTDIAAGITAGFELGMEFRKGSEGGVLWQQKL